MGSIRSFSSRFTRSSEREPRKYLSSKERKELRFTSLRFTRGRYTEGAAAHGVSDKSLVFHDPQDGLDGLVVQRTIFFRSSQEILDGAFSQAPKNFEQAELRRSRYCFRSRQTWPSFILKADSFVPSLLFKGRRHLSFRD